MGREPRVDDYSATLGNLLASDVSAEDLTRSLFYYAYNKTLSTDPELAEIMRACAIPSGLDAEVIGVLRDAPRERKRNKQLISELSKFGFVITRKDGRFVYHDNARDMLLREWRAKPNRKAFRVYVERLTNYYYEQAQKFRRKKEHQKALTFLNLFSELRPKDPNLYWQLGLTHYDLLDYRAALEDFSKAIKLTPQKSSLYSWRGRMHFKLRAYDAALADYNKAIELSPIAANFRNRGRTYSELKQFENAINDFTTASKLEPRDPLNYYLRGLSHFELKEYKQALSDLTKSLKLNPEEVSILIWRGLVNNKLKRYQAALGDFEKAVEVAPKDDVSYVWLGRIHLRLNHQKDAVLNFNKAIRLNPTEAVFYNARSMAFFVAAQYSKSLADLQKAIKLEPNEPRHHYSSGVLNYAQGKYKVAESAFEKAISLNAADAKSYLFRALCRLVNGNTTAALKDVNEAKKIYAKGTSDKADSEVFKAHTIFWRGVTRYLMGRSSSAKGDWQAARGLVSANDNTCDQQRVLARIALVGNDESNARKHYMRALSSLCHVTAMRVELALLDELSLLLPSQAISNTKDWFGEQLKKRIDTPRSSSKRAHKK